MAIVTGMFNKKYQLWFGLSDKHNLVWDNNKGRESRLWGTISTEIEAKAILNFVKNEKDFFTDAKLVEIHEPISECHTKEPETPLLQRKKF